MNEPSDERTDDRIDDPRKPARVRPADLLATALLAVPMAGLLGATVLGAGLALGAWDWPVLPAGEERLGVWLGLSLVLICWEPARRMAPRWAARFDSACLRPPEPAAPAAPASAAPARQALQEWCFQGAGDGRSPLWAPSAPPDMPVPLNWASFPTGHAGATALLVEDFMCELDGTRQLQALSQAKPGRWAGLALRLRVKWNDGLWWRARQPSDPWDCGHLRPEGLADLAAFRPRRATLIVVDGGPDGPALQALSLLRAGQQGFAHPVRLLALGPRPPQGWALVKPPPARSPA